MLVRHVEQQRLDLRPQERAELVGVDHRVEPLRGPAGEAVAVVACGLALGAVVKIAGQADPHRELGLLGRIELPRQGLDPLGHLGLAQADPLGGVDGDAELVMEPAGERAAAPVLLEKLAGRLEVDLVDHRGRLLDQERLPGPRVRTRARSGRHWANLRRSRSLRFKP